MKKVNITDNFSHLNRFDKPADFEGLTKEEQSILLNWCKQLEPTKTIYKGLTSYGLKHVFEASPGGFSISNGAFKGAMILLGFQVDDPIKVNWCFNISKTSINEVRKKLVRLPI